jgi:molybdate transport system ATP-binding protein
VSDPDGLVADVGLTRGDLDLDLRLRVEPGQVVAVVGPNAAGKSTLLAALAGLVPLATGRVALDGDVLEDPASATFVPPERRSVGLVFQDLLLFPHLSVRDNVAFGLRRAGAGRVAAGRRAGVELEALGMAPLADARPATLSGGQAARVALARALAPDPRLLLLDEPLAAVDVAGAAELRSVLRRRLRGRPGPAVVVTHDPVEAMVLGDRLAVVERGRVVQTGSPEELSRHPRTPYVAQLVGVNLFRGTAAEGRVALATGAALVTAVREVAGPAFAAVPPEAVAVFVERPSGSPRNVWPGRVRSVEAEGGRARVAVDADVPLVALVTRAAVDDLGLAEGRAVWVAVKATDVRVYAA